MKNVIKIIALTIITILAQEITINAQYRPPYYQPYPPQQRQVQLKHVGVSSSKMNYYASSQKNSQWCWAASIQMVLNYYGVKISQEQIVARTYGTDPYGRLPNWAGSFEAITANLNNWGVDNSGREYKVRASLNWGAPTPAVLLRELSKKRPVIVGYRGPQGGHAVVITAASSTKSPYGPIIQTITVRDPMPTPMNIHNRGKVVYPGAQIASLMQAYWYIKVRRK